MNKMEDASEQTGTPVETREEKTRTRKSTTQILMRHKTQTRVIPKTALNDWDREDCAMSETCAISLGFPTDQGNVRPRWTGPDSHTFWTTIEFKIEANLSYDVVLGSKALEELREDGVSILACYARLISERMFT